MALTRRQQLDIREMMQKATGETGTLTQLKKQYPDLYQSAVFLRTQKEYVSQHSAIVKDIAKKTGASKEMIVNNINKSRLYKSMSLDSRRKWIKRLYKTAYKQWKDWDLTTEDMEQVLGYVRSDGVEVG
jgi:acyl-[acyl carrier protein]--UDP-N-acetylglucosamine O-acyltransferase